MTQSHAEVIASNIRAEMARRRITQERMALAIGMGRQSLNRRLHGQTPIDVNELAAIARVLELPIQELLGAEQAAS